MENERGNNTSGRADPERTNPGPNRPYRSRRMESCETDCGDVSFVSGGEFSGGAGSCGGNTQGPGSSAANTPDRLSSSADPTEASIEFSAGTAGSERGYTAPGGGESRFAYDYYSRIASGQSAVGTDISGTDISETDVSHADSPGTDAAADRRDAVFVAVSFGLGFALCELVLFGGWGISVPIVWAGLYAAAFCYMRPRLKRPGLPQLAANLPAVLVALCFILYDNSVLRVFNAAALYGASAFGLAQLAGLGGRPVIYAGTVKETLGYMFGLPLRHLGKTGRALFCSGRGSRKLPAVLLTLLVTSPLLALVLSLLSGSDTGFARLLWGLRSFFGRQAAHYLTETVIAAVLVFPIFGFLWGLRHDAPAARPAPDAQPRYAGLEPAVVCTALGVFSGVYAVYMALQSDYFFSAVLGCLPQGFTVSGYARQGFFELVGVAAINFCLIAAACALSRRRGGRITPGPRGQIILLAVMTLLLIATAASKMFMYMSRYGLTPLRVYTSWFMLLLAVFCALVIAGMLCPGFDSRRISIICAVIMWLALNYVNTDSIIVNYNINMYKNNPATTLDVGVFYELSDSALPQIAALKDDAKVGQEIQAFLNSRKAELRSQKWQDYSAASRAALECAEKAARS
jgi:hypothetical protein